MPAEELLMGLKDKGLMGKCKYIYIFLNTTSCIFWNDATTMKSKYNFRSHIGIVPIEEQ